MATYAYTFTSGDVVTPTKLNDARTVSEIVNADIGASAAIVATKLASDSITDTQIKSDAAILGTKIAPDFGSQNAEANSFTANAQGSAGIRIANPDTTSGSFSTLAFRSAGDGTARDRALIGGGHESANNSGYLFFETRSGGVANERMRITSGGTVLVGKTASGFGTEGCEMFASGTIYATRDNDLCLTLNRLNGNGTVVSIRRSGTAVGSISVTATATSYNESSDYRLKENPTPITGALDIVAALKPVNFTWKVDGSAGRGFIAHELQTVVPEAVTGEKDAVDAEGTPEYQGVDKSKIVPLLVAAVQELSAKVAALEAAQ